MADLTPDLQVYLSWGSIAKSFHSLRSLSVFFFCFFFSLCQLFPCHLGPPRPTLSISLYVTGCFLTAPLEHSRCPYQPSLLSFRMRSSVPSNASSSLDLMLTMSSRLTLQICLIIAVIPLQTLEVWLCQWPSLTGIEHCALKILHFKIVSNISWKLWEIRTWKRSDSW